MVGRTGTIESSDVNSGTEAGPSHQQRSHSESPSDDPGDAHEPRPKRVLTPDRMLRIAELAGKVMEQSVHDKIHDLLKEIRFNGDQQITLLKASLGDAWLEVDQATRLKDDLSSEEPWRTSDEGFVRLEGLPRELQGHGIRQICGRPPGTV
ncbi:hypothetical protein PG996_007644 [Apiospora saccharicola]|uniref:Uncharacterized protein n=1 Tax=Apiospora saccharicola TaxID=335842 RepID=A0ABR1VBE4_9PEZI